MVVEEENLKDMFCRASIVLGKSINNYLLSSIFVLNILAKMFIINKDNNTINALRKDLFLNWVLKKELIFRSG